MRLLLGVEQLLDSELSHEEDSISIVKTRREGERHASKQAPTDREIPRECACEREKEGERSRSGDATAEAEESSINA